MGKNKIPIELIKNATKRKTTFAKRHLGVQKKAHELSVLCNAQAALIYFDENDELFTFSSTDIPERILEKYETVPEDTRRRRHHECKTELAVYVQKHEDSKSRKRGRSHQPHEAMVGANAVANNHMANEANMGENHFSPTMSNIQHDVPNGNLAYHHVDSTTRPQYTGYPPFHPHQGPLLPMQTPYAQFVNHGDTLNVSSLQQSPDIQVLQNQANSTLNIGSYGYPSHMSNPNMPQYENSTQGNQKRPNNLPGTQYHGLPNDY